MEASTILIVDDDAANRHLAKALLSPLGYRLREAASGEEALQSVGMDIPDLVLLDVRMPGGMDGYTVCERLKQDVRTKLIPIIMLTSLQQVEDRIKAIETGADDFLSKPFHREELAARVKSLLALKHYTDELENVSSVLKGIAKVVEYRDAYTGGHCERVGEYGARVAAAMGLGADDVKAISLAGTLHDLGKIGIPDSILRKPGPLSDVERTIMKTHTTTGAMLVEPMVTMGKILPYIRHHHERLDGSGYPDGLLDEDIPMPVRILSVVDIYDALTTRRPYKEAFSQEKSLAILREEAGRGWWDRNVIDHLAETLTMPLAVPAV